MLYVIGLGSGDERDITLRGLDAVKKCEKEKLYGKPIILADREMVEEKVDNLLLEADIHVKEPTLESLCRGRKLYETPRYMTINTAIEQLLEVEQNYGESVHDEDTDCVGFAWLGSEDQMIVAGTMRQLRMVDFGNPLRCLVIVGKTHPVEEEMLEFYKIRSENSNRKVRNCVNVLSNRNVSSSWCRCAGCCCFRILY
ncbi:probable diphthine methyl ester synthase isoform X2 [Durio zibethinus]|uniref:Probable diphthine methyl ester synthase isoform X2 n=1 Tax=Durio zibethinus TaxID=66656 RepID=A0A6P5ZIM4_DURZI|nr:probable diphthine methyl ester synthase isoform X2 [Durio zibethinus]